MITFKVCKNTFSSCTENCKTQIIKSNANKGSIAVLLPVIYNLVKKSISNILETIGW